MEHKTKFKQGDKVKISTRLSHGREDSLNEFKKEIEGNNWDYLTVYAIGFDNRTIGVQGPNGEFIQNNAFDESDLEIYNEMKEEHVNHPSHYGGDTTYEAIKVIEAWNLGFCLGNTVKYISRAGKKDPSKTLEDLLKAKWYLDREITNLENQ